MAKKRKRARRLTDAYAFSGVRVLRPVHGVFGDPKVRVVALVRRKKTLCGVCGRAHRGWYDRRTRWVRDLSAGDYRIYLKMEVRRVHCRRCGAVKRERLDVLIEERALHQAVCLLRRPPLSQHDNLRTSHKNWRWTGTQSRSGTSSTCAPSSPGPGTPGPRRIGIDEISIKKRHTYRIVVSDLDRGRSIWFGGDDRSEASMAQFYAWLGEKKSKRIQLALMDRWKPFRNATRKHAPQAAILFDKFHVMRRLGEALDQVRKSAYARLSGKNRRFIEGQKYTLLSHRENLTLEGRQSLKTLLAANKRRNTAYLLKESFGQLWSYQREGWAQRFFENWRASLKWQRLSPTRSLPR